jgi:hypothetical protein
MELTPADFVLLVLFGAFGGVFLFSMISKWLQVREHNRAMALRVICRLCLHAFEDASHVKSLNCPVCGAANEKPQRRRLGYGA